MIVMNVLRIYVQRSSEISIKAALDEARIDYSQTLLFTHNFSAVIEIIGKINDAMPWSSVERLLIAWIQAKQQRRITIVKETANGEFEKIDATGYSAKEVGRLLANGARLELHEHTGPDRTQVR